MCSTEKVEWVGGKEGVLVEDMVPPLGSVLPFDGLGIYCVTRIAAGFVNSTIVERRRLIQGALSVRPVGIIPEAVGESLD